MSEILTVATSVSCADRLKVAEAAEPCVTGVVMTEGVAILTFN